MFRKLPSRGPMLTNRLAEEAPVVANEGDGGVKAAPSGAVLVDLESGIGRGTGLATGGGGGSKNDPGTLPWPLPLGCEQHK